MNSISCDPTIATAEAVLVAAGLDPSTVAECDDERCRWCGAAVLPAAA